MKSKIYPKGTIGYRIQRVFPGGLRKVGGLIISCRGRTRLLVVALFFIATMISGCWGDAFYEFILENDRGQAVTVHVLGTEVVMRPCSVLSKSWGGVPYGQPVGILVTDDAGQVVHRTEIKAGPRGAGNPFYIQIPASESNACPPPAATFMLTVWNSRDSKARIVVAGVDVGVVEPHSRQQFGPLTGTWQDAQEIVISSGEREYTAATFGLRMDYDLGRVPDIRVVIPEYGP